MTFYMKMENNPLLLKTFTVNNQLDRDFYIRGRHEGADNSLCKTFLLQFFGLWSL